MSQAEELTPIEQLRAALEANPLIEGAGIEEMRAHMEEVCQAHPLRADMEITPMELAGVSGEWVKTPASREDYVILYFHGGGYALGSPRTHRTLTGEIAHLTRSRVFAADYRMAPEHVFPAAVEDGVAVWRALIEEAGIVPAKAAIAGDSAGGGLTMATLLSVRDQKLPLPAFAYLISPWLDLTGESKTLISNDATDPIVKKDGLLNLAALYLAGASAKEAYASPLFADMAGLPPILIQATSAETLYDDSRLLAERAERAGVEIELQNWEGLVHVFQMFHALLPEGHEALEKLAQFTEAHWRVGR